jgi:hypothetical protein
VPVATLRTTPYSIEWGLSIWATVTAVNIYGLSVESDPGNGEIILMIPDSPINLVNVPEITLATQIGLDWVEASENGGTPVLDYTVSYDQGIGVYTTFASSILPTEYTVISLT